MHTQQPLQSAFFWPGRCPNCACCWQLKSIIHPRNLWVRGSNLTWGHYRLSCPRSADTALKPYLTCCWQAVSIWQPYWRLCWCSVCRAAADGRFKTWVCWFLLWKQEEMGKARPQACSMSLPGMELMAPDISKPYNFVLPFSYYLNLT